jgi:prolycopene isomerase
MLEAMRCRFCEHPSCTRGEGTDIRGVMRRVAVGNFVGARKCWQKAEVNAATLAEFESRCIWNREGKEAVQIRQVIHCVRSKDE